MLTKNIYQGKKIAVLGFSVEGMAITDFLYKHGAFVTIADQKTENQFDRSYLDKFKKKNVDLMLGPLYLKTLKNQDLIVRSPGFPLWHESLTPLLKKGLVTSQTKIFFELCPGKIIGVTGTKGKGTTATLIYKLLKDAGKKVYLGGNIGNPPITFLDQLTAESLVVLELSSFQLEDLNRSPHIAVVLNMTSDHLFSSSYESPNYHTSHQEYINAKENIVKYQKKSDFAVLNIDYPQSNYLKKLTTASIWFNSNRSFVKKGVYVKKNAIILNSNSNHYLICKADKVQLRGKHNLENITAAVCASYLAGTAIKGMGKTIISFKGLEHRLEFVSEINGVKFYNDSFSTIPETTIAAINSFYEPIILICGGSEKNSDYTYLGNEVVKNNIKMVILIGAMANKIKKSIDSASKNQNKPAPKLLMGIKNMKDIVDRAKQWSRPGDVILLSPACASFDMFKNYKDRGNLFKLAVYNLNEK